MQRVRFGRAKTPLFNHLYKSRVPVYIDNYARGALLCQRRSTLWETNYDIDAMLSVTLPPGPLNDLKAKIRAAMKRRGYD